MAILGKDGSVVVQVDSCLQYLCAGTVRPGLLFCLKCSEGMKNAAQGVPRSRSNPHPGQRDNSGST
jgi:hypothetical protein